jgi:hypothetical protein
MKEEDIKMIEIRTEKHDSPIHCIICGTQTTDAQGLVEKCLHLEYLGMDEGVEFSIYDDVEGPEDNGEWIQYNAQLNEFRKKLDDQHLCIHVDTPAPSFCTYSIIYNLNANIKDTKNPQNLDGVKISKDEYEECPFWNVWGPTLKKYGIVAPELDKAQNSMEISNQDQDRQQ